MSTGAGAAGGASGAAASSGAGASSGGNGAAAGAQAGAAGAGAAGGQGGTTGAAAPADWMEGLDGDMKGFISNKGFKTPAELANSYRNLEKLRGAPQERILTLPEAMYDNEGKLTVEGRAVAERLGTPKEKKNYALESLMPKENGDPKLMEHFTEIFFEAGISKTQAEKIVKSWNALQDGRRTSATEIHAANFTKDQNDLKTEWGLAHDQNIQIATEATKAIGMTKEQINALSASLGHAGAMKLLYKMGSSVQESTFINGNSGGKDRIKDPAGAQARIKDLRADKEFGDKLLAGDAEAKGLWQRLHEQAYPGDVRIN